MYSIERIQLSPRGVMWTVLKMGKRVFSHFSHRPFDGHLLTYAWDRKKDAQKIIEAIKERGLEAVRLEEYGEQNWTEEI